MQSQSILCPQLLKSCHPEWDLCTSLIFIVTWVWANLIHINKWPLNGEAWTQLHKQQTLGEKSHYLLTKDRNQATKVLYMWDLVAAGYRCFLLPCLLSPTIPGLERSTISSIHPLLSISAGSGLIDCRWDASWKKKTSHDKCGPFC